jgi:hypothetical protein
MFGPPIPDNPPVIRCHGINRRVIGQRGGAPAGDARLTPPQTTAAKRDSPPAETAASAVQAGVPVPARPQLPELDKKRLGLLQDWCVETFGEPVVDRRKQVTRFRLPALIAPEPGEAG